MRAKAFSFCFRDLRTISRPASIGQNRFMDASTVAELSEEIDDLKALIRNLECQLAWARQTSQQLRIRNNRHEATLGLEEAA